MHRIPALLALLVLAAGSIVAPRYLTSHVTVNPDFTHFESAHVHPAVLTPDGTRLLVVNTADNRLTVFDLTGAVPVRIAEIPVGLEPVSVAARTNDEAWVVNHLSDDVSIVDLGTRNVRATLRVGDEPADVLFANGRAYVSVSQEDRVRSYDPANLSLVPIDIAIPGRMPRALARSADGSRVYVAVLFAGNRTTVLSESEVPDDSLPADPEFPRSPALAGHVRPQTGLIVRQDAVGNWRDSYGTLWNSKVPYTVNEVDVAEIQTGTNTVSRTFGDLGAVNFGLAVSPVDGRIVVTATEALNHLRLEPRLSGHTVDTQIGFVTQAGNRTVRNLNPHIDYDVLPGTPAERDSALGTPTAVAFSSDGARVYLTSLASDRLGVIDPGPFPARPVLARIPTVAGPTGVVVDDARNRVYVVGRFRNQLQTIATSDLSTLAIAAIGYDPTPDAIVNGRRFFYGGFTSAHGDQSCASCHVFGDFDNLAWDLGDPSGDFQPPPPGQIDALLEGFDPEKGPMTTQTLRGLPGTGVLHWRGDRTNLTTFNHAFVSLMGRTVQLPDSEMTAFEGFVLPLVHPPNPAQLLDRTMPDAPAGVPSAKRGQNFFLTLPVLPGDLNCNSCHTIPTGTNGQLINDAKLLQDQDLKVPQLRNLYRKTGFKDTTGAVNKRGFGFTHDGSVDNVFNFLKFPNFEFGAGANNKRRDLEAFVLAFDTGLAPAVGARITFATAGTAGEIARLDTLKSQAAAGNCELVAKGRVAGQSRGWRYAGSDLWQSDLGSEAALTSAQLRSLAATGSELTITGVPPGSALRMGIDRDRDTYLDGDERMAGSDPSNPLSTPGNVSVSPARAAPFAMGVARPNPFRSVTEVSFTLGRAGPVECTVYDVLGRHVRSIARGVTLEAGRHGLSWDGRRADGSEAGAGVYFLRVKTEAAGATRAVIRVR